MPNETRDALTAIKVILEAVSAQSGMKVTPGTLPFNALHQATVTVGGDNVTARSLLEQVISQAKLRLYWVLLYDPHFEMFGFSVRAARRAQYDASGNRTTVQIR